MRGPTAQALRAPAGLAVPGEVVLHPVALAALGLWIVNDHALKAWWGNGLTGKLSDVASLVFFPLLLVAVVELVSWAAGRKRWQTSSRWAVLVAAAMTGFVMATINLFEPCAVVYQQGLGLLQWPFLSAAALWSGQALPAPGTVELTMDPSDLWTLPALAAPVWLVWQRGTEAP